MELLNQHVDTRSFLGRLIAKMIQFDKTMALGEQVRRERRELSKLDARALADIGISREDAEREHSRSFLDLPAGRLPHHQTQPGDEQVFHSAVLKKAHCCEL